MLKTIINYLTILLAKNYDKKIINKLNLLNIKPEIIFDIGCHVGEQTELFLRSFSSINRIYCFEPQKDIFRIFKNKFINNSKIVPINKACSDKNTFCNFNILLHKRSSTLEKNNFNSFYYKIKTSIVLKKNIFSMMTREKKRGGGSGAVLLDKQVRVKTVTLDKYFLKKVDLLKIDVEGDEYKILNSVNKDFFLKFKIIIIEFHNLHYLFNEKFFFSFQDIIEKIINNFYCVHIHPNNDVDFIKIKENIIIPPLMEFTFINKKNSNINDEKLFFPNKLDSDNNTDKRSIVLPDCWNNA
jgi:FkbM family methyltransferase